MKEKTTVVSQKVLMELLYWARRYCDGRSTYAPHTFNGIYDILVKNCPELVDFDHIDITLKDEGQYWPYAQDGMYNEETKCFDARK